MLYTKEYKTEQAVKGITPTLFRNYILSKIENLDKEDLKKIHFHLSEEDFKNPKTRKIPHIIFAKPLTKSFYLKAYGEDGLLLLNKINKCLDDTFKIDNRVFNIKEVNEYAHSVIPSKTEELFTYRTVTPILLFTGAKRKVFDGIYFKHLNDKKEFDEVLKNSVNAMLRANMKNILRTIVKDKEYKALNDIDIEWIEFKVIMRFVRGVKTPAVVGSFKSHWELPHCLGSRTGIGYGLVMKNIKNKPQLSKKVQKVYGNGSAHSKLMNITRVKKYLLNLSDALRGKNA